MNLDTIEKALTDLNISKAFNASGKLVLKEIIDKNGHRQHKWIDPTSKEVLVEHHKVGDKVKFTHKGEEHTGDVIKVYHSKNSPKVNVKVKSDKSGESIEREQSSFDSHNSNNSTTSTKVEKTPKVKETSHEEHTDAETADKENYEPPTEKLARFRRMIKSVINFDHTHLLAFGVGGVGKTYNVITEMEKKGMVPFDEDVNVPAHMLGDDDSDDDDGAVKSRDYDYIKITGKATPTAVFQMLYEHNGKTILFDDCDSVLENDDAVNILKGAMDTSGDGTITYASGKDILGSDGEVLPKRFKFKGKVIFISNKSAEEFTKNPDLRALKTRCEKINLTFDNKETMEVVNDIIDNINFKGLEHATKEDKRDAAKLIEDNLKYIPAGGISTRSIRSVLLAKLNMKRLDKEDLVGYDWKQEAKRKIIEKANKGKAVSTTDLIHNNIVSDHFKKANRIYNSF